MFFNISFSQTYSFDFLTKYKSTNSKGKTEGEIVSYFNSDNSDYYLRINRTQEEFKGTIYDSKMRQGHVFDIVETKKEGKIFFTFKYKSTFRFAHRLPQKFYYQITEISNASPKKVKVEIHRRKNSKKPLEEYLIDLVPANKNLFALSRMTLMHPHEFENELSFPGNYIVQKAELIKKQISCSYTLNDFNNVELDIILPEKLDISTFR